MEEEEIPPIINQIYRAFVSNVDNTGYHIRLLDFEEDYEGLIHKSLIDTEKSQKLNRGRIVKVKVTGLLNTLIIMDLLSIEAQFMERDSRNRRDDDEKVVRISSPERERVKEMSGICNNVTVTLKDLPPILGLLKLCLNESHSKGGMFNSVIKIPEGFMLSNAILMRTKDFGLFSDFLRRSKGTSNNMYENWITGEKFGTTLESLNMPLETTENPVEVWGSRKSAAVIKKQRELLPIFKVRNDIIKAVVNNKFLIVQGETGSGKSTQIPQYLLEAGFAKEGKIVCTQPRKLAAMSLAKRVAEEQGCALGAEVGYKHRFVDKTSNMTLIKYCTEGVLLRECLNTNNIQTYSVIILDEAHERTTNTDVLLGLVKKEIERLPNMRVIISSATLEAKKFSKFFDDAPIFFIEGRTFPVEIYYRPSNVEDYLHAALATVIHIHLTEKKGDILLFLTGQDEINYACEILEKNTRSLEGLVVLPIYSALDYNEQLKVFESVPHGKRKCVISTNVAETSMTIDGIYYVIDPGYSKLKMFEPKSGMEVLQIFPISQASADQRAGRAGRTGPGKCYRIYTKDSYNKFLKTTIPEIQRSSLAQVVLQFKAFGIDDLRNFKFIDPPSQEVLYTAEKELYLLNAIDEDLIITNLGRRMVDLPLEPNLAKMLCISIDLKCSNEILTIIALLSVQNVFYRPRNKQKQQKADQQKAKLQSPISDLITLLNTFNAWKKNSYSSEWCRENFVNEKSLNEAYEIRQALREKMEQRKLEIFSCGKNHERIQKAICAGLALNVATKYARKFSYKTIHYNGEAYIHPSSGLMRKNPQWLVYSSLTETKKKYMRDVTIIDPAWLKKFASSVYNIY